MKRFDKLWEALGKGEKNVFRYFACINKPVSIDDLSTLSGESAVVVINFMADLKKKRLIRESTSQKGIYSIVSAEAIESAMGVLPEKLLRETLERIITFYKDAGEPDDTSLMLADLYQRLGNIQEGASYMLEAARVLYRLGQMEKALTYFESILNFYEKHKPTDKNQAVLFLDSVLEEVSIMMQFMPMERKIDLLRRAEGVAEEFKDRDRLARVKLVLAVEFQGAGQYKLASRYMGEFQRSINETHDIKIQKETVWSVCEFYTWTGRYVEGTRYYEEVIGDIEEFGDDEKSLKTAALVGWCFSVCGRIARGMGMVETVRAKAEARGFIGVAHFAELMAILALLEIRKIPDAEIRLKKLSAVAGEEMGHIGLRGICHCQAYILCIKEQYEEAFRRHEEGMIHVRAIGWIHHPGAWVFEYLSFLESKGFSDKEFNYDSEIRRLLDWGDISMKGVALRYRALKKLKDRKRGDDALEDLKESEKCLFISGAQIELARTRAALWEYYRKTGKKEIADTYFEKARLFLSTMDASLFPDDLRAIMPQEQKIEFMTEKIVAINHLLGSVRDRSTFFEKIINAAMEFTLATRGIFIIVEPGGFKVAASRNFDASLLSSERLEAIKGAIIEAATNAREIVISGPAGRKDTIEDVFRRAGITSLLGMPAKLDDGRYGYLILDNRLGGGTFPADILPFVRILCSQISAGLSAIGTYEEVNALKERYEEEAAFYKKEMGVAATTEMILGPSGEMKTVLDRISQVALADSSVLILGETGVGKELVAKTIHNASKRKNGPFIPVNLAALSQELTASELFGHEKGAFTGAHERHKGRFELADGGTIFLDEIGDLSLSVQVKLLRVLQEGVFERVGSAKPISSNFRVIAATNKNLALEAEKGTFRQDLYWRLNVFPIYVPPLRERKEDIPLLVRHFLDYFAAKMGKKMVSLSPKELTKLMAYHWPGNIRELKHYVERAVILSDGHRISFPDPGYGTETPKAAEHLVSRSLADVEREHIERVLASVRWQVSGPKGAASILGLKPTTLLFRMKKLGIKKPDIPL